MAIEFRCSDVGVVCNAATRADSKEELLAKVEAHAKKAHGVELTQTLIDFALTKVHEV